MKKKIIIIICAVCVFGYINGKAKETVKSDDIKIIEDKLVKDEDIKERTKVEKELNNHILLEKNSNTKDSDLMLSKNDKGDNIYDIKKAYRVNLLDNFWLTDYFEDGNFKKISGNIQWKVPYHRDNGENGIATFAKEGEKYVWLGESLGEQQEEIPKSEEVVARIIAKEGIVPESILKTEYLYSQMYKLVLIHIKTKDMEYVIPYAEFPETLQSLDQKSQVINGNIYKIQDFMEEMNKIFDEEYLLLHPNESTGLYYRRHKTKSGIYVVVAVIIIAGGFMWKRYRMRG